MVALIEFLFTLGPWNWLLLAALLFVLETLVPGVYFVWFGTAAMTIGGLLLAGGALAPDATAAIGWQLQVIAFALLSVATIFVFRMFAGDASDPSDAPNLNARASRIRSTAPGHPRQDLERRMWSCDGSGEKGSQGDRSGREGDLG